MEDTDENYYQIDRMMAQLQIAGMLKQISGFIFGQCTDCAAEEPSVTASTLSSIGSLSLN